VQHVVRRLLDRLRDGVTVGWAKEQRSEDQQVERSLEQLDSLSFGRHPR
jgi:hypothetical protein